jgi:hypothetical protein
MAADDDFAAFILTGTQSESASENEVRREMQQ